MVYNKTCSIIPVFSSLAYNWNLMRKCPISGQTDLTSLPVFEHSGWVVNDKMEVITINPPNNCIRWFYHTEKRNPEHKATFQKKQCQDCDQVHTKLDHKCTRFLPNVIYTQNHCYQTALLPNVISNQNHCYQTALLQNDFYQRTLLPNEFYKWHYHQTALLKNEFLFLIKIR